MTVCPVSNSLVEIEINRIATQYREANRLIGYMRAVLGEVEDAASAVCDIPNHFEITTAVGHQLTLIGKRMGFGRRHCACVAQSVFGFPYPVDNPLRPIAGFCADATWEQCGADGASDIAINDDEVYRAHLLARRYQMLGLFDVGSLTAAIRTVWGQTAWLPRSRLGQIVLAPGRTLDAEEMLRLQITLRILPIAPGVEAAMWFKTTPVFGFGEGWAGMCRAPDSPNTFGFACDDGSTPTVTGFCDDDQTWGNCLPAGQTAGEWLCPVKIDPYGCN